MIDVAPDIRAALADPPDELVERIADRVVAKMQAAQSAKLLSQSELARHLGLTPKALSHRLARGSELLAIALILDGKRWWRSVDVDALLARGAK